MERVSVSLAQGNTLGLIFTPTMCFPEGEAEN